jgi:hypothetical protein
MTHYLRFPDEATGMAALDAAGLLTDEGSFITASHTHALDVIGAIYVGGKYDSETGEVIEPQVLLDGWHANYIGELPEGWEDFLVTPEQPSRVFAG